jgi:hypothetical protein
MAEPTVAVDVRASDGWRTRTSGGRRALGGGSSTIGPLLRSIKPKKY